MSYYITAFTKIPFQEAIDRVTGELKNEGFGVITTIDVKNTLKQKIDIDFRKYTILGACNPVFAHRALTMDDKIGTLLPCNVIIQESDGGTEISAINPRESMKGIMSGELVEFASEITARLERVIKKFES
jgi:uncharacterized protein (DUF302 family)